MSKTKPTVLRNQTGFEVFCGIDVASETHHAVALNRDGDRLVDRPLLNAEPDQVKLFDQLEACWHCSPPQQEPNRAAEDR